MNLRLQIVDTDTGEILAHVYKNYALNFNCKDDAGFRCILAWCQSCVRGIRLNGKKNLDLNLHFADECCTGDLFCGMSREEFNKKAEAFLV